ncbi:MAG: hypothetical protein GY861_00305 [bacterium]|nr:hypothetical protein [bacterium]
MPIVDKNKKQANTPEMAMLSYSKSWRIKYEIARFVTQMFIEQNAFYKGTNGKLTQQKSPRNYRNITKARTIMRGIKNALTKEEPRRQAKHFTLENDKISEEERRGGMRLLQKVYRDESVKEKIKDLLHNSLMKSV